MDWYSEMEVRFQNQIGDDWMNRSFDSEFGASSMGSEDSRRPFLSDTNSSNTSKLQFAMDSDHRILVVSIRKVLYPITEQVIHQVIDSYGNIDHLDLISLKNGDIKAVIWFRRSSSAASTKNSLQGRNIYDGCCHLDIEFYWKEIPIEESIEVLEASHNGVHEVLDHSSSQLISESSSSSPLQAEFQATMDQITADIATCIAQMNSNLAQLNSSISQMRFQGQDEIVVEHAEKQPEMQTQIDCALKGLEFQIQKPRNSLDIAPIVAEESRNFMMQPLHIRISSVEPYIAESDSVQKVNGDVAARLEGKEKVEGDRAEVTIQSSAASTENSPNVVHFHTVTQPPLPPETPPHCTLTFEDFTAKETIEKCLVVTNISDARKVFDNIPCSIEYYHIEPIPELPYHDPYPCCLLVILPPLHPPLHPPDVTGFHGAIGTLDVQFSGFEINGLKNNYECTVFGEAMAETKTEEVLVELEEILGDEEPANATNGHDFTIDGSCNSARKMFNSVTLGVIDEHFTSNLMEPIKEEVEGGNGVVAGDELEFSVGSLYATKEMQPPQIQNSDVEDEIGNVVGDNFIELNEGDVKVSDVQCVPADCHAQHQAQECSLFRTLDKLEVSDVVPILYSSNRDIGEAQHLEIAISSKKGKGR